ncbi:MAG TPA: hypothetical protein VFS02_04075 [Telluria sp.]|nr:hypothetical protein [Telluria sp.]
MDALGDSLPVDVEPVRENLAARAHRQQYAGLAFSGGGIRSATFNLGMLQALAELNMLRDFHFLSTVSGGGYIGAWFAKWLKRQEGKIGDLEGELTPGSSTQPKREPEELKFLRQYTNYLTPKTGFFSADTWSLLSTYVRNTILNLTILALMLAAVMVVPRLLVIFIRDAGDDNLVWSFPANQLSLMSGSVMWLDLSNFRYQVSVFASIAVIAALWSVFWTAASVSGIPDPGSRHRLWRQSQNSIIWFIVLPQLVAAFFGSAAIWPHHTAIDKSWDDLIARPAWNNAIIVWLWTPGVAYFAAWLAGWKIAQNHNKAMRAVHNLPAVAPDKEERVREGVGHFLCALTVLAVGAVLVVMTTSALNDWYTAPPERPVAAGPIPAAAQKVSAAARTVATAAQEVTTSAHIVTDAAHAVTALARGTPVTRAATANPYRPDPMTVPLIAFGIPIMLALFGLTMVLSVGLVGRLYTDKSREWWSRLGGWVAIFVIAWLAVITVSLYAPAAVGYFHAMFGDWASALLGSAWLGTTLTGLLIGKSGATGTPNAKSRLDWLARAAPLVFSIGALCVVSSALHELLQPHHVPRLTDSHTPFSGFLITYDNETMDSSYARLGLTLAGLLAIGLLLAWRVDINKFSLHMMYRNRLVRAYLGAINKTRQPHPFTGFDPADDERLDDMFAPNQQLQKPYLIVNAALNLVNGTELAWQTRKAANFTFTPAFCGFELPSMASPGGAKLVHEAMRGGFRRTTSYGVKPGGGHDEESGINLGMAVAVSGAAASPSMGYHSSPPLAFLMTLFNVRLGRWFANPVRPIPKGPAKRLRRALKARWRHLWKQLRPAMLRKASRALRQREAPPRPVRKGFGRPPRTSPRIGLWYLLKELFGLTDAKANFVYLSDGGHFENLGIYELVRRRCRLIVVVDAGADGQFDFEDLGNAIRKCGTDLNVEIEIEVGRIDLLKQSEFSRSHCVTGAIRYDKVDRGGKVGTLLYIKPSLLGTEYADVLNYRKTNKTFPHQPTADQWFDETQFETYRSLGYNIGRIALQKASEAAARNKYLDGLERHNIESLCAALHATWDNPDQLKDELRNAGRPRRPTEYRRESHRRATQGAANVIPIDRRKADRRRA